MIAMSNTNQCKSTKRTARNNTCKVKAQSQMRLAKISHREGYHSLLVGKDSINCRSIFQRRKTYWQ